MKNKKNKTSSGGLKKNKNLGQNFLIDQSVVRQIIDCSSISENSLVIEIGPGDGAMTEDLAKRAGKVVAIEIDDRLVSILNVKFMFDENVSIIHNDVLKVDINELIQQEKQNYEYSDVRIIGNLPYYISTPIITMLLEQGLQADSITVMLQKEVAERILANPGERAAGVITYQVHYYSTVAKVCDVGRECFDPMPGVDSIVIRMDLRSEPPVSVKDEQKFFRCIKAAFGLRRKTLLNSLCALTEYTKDEIQVALKQAGIDPGRRGETLSFEEFARLSDFLGEQGGLCEEAKP